MFCVIGSIEKKTNGNCGICPPCRLQKENLLGFICSDVLRVAILYKFGGTYMDTDIITLGDHPSVLECPNFVNFEEAGSINGAMMRFQAKHPVLESIAERLGRIHAFFIGLLIYLFIRSANKYAM